MAWPGTLAKQVLGTLIGVSHWDDIIDAINFLGNTHDHSGDSGDGSSIANLTFTNPTGTNQALTDGATINWDADNGVIATVTLGGNRTLANPTNLNNAGTLVLIVKQDGTGSRTLSYGANYKWPGGTAPTLSTGVNDVDILCFVTDGTNMYGGFQLDFS